MSNANTNSKSSSTVQDENTDPRYYVMNEYNNIVLHGRAGFDTFSFVRQIPNYLSSITKEFTSAYHYCGYLVIEADSPFALLLNDSPSGGSCPVHGGVTWYEKSAVNDKYIVVGFDTAHLMSGVWSEDRILEELNRFGAWVEGYNSCAGKRNG